MIGHSEAIEPSAEVPHIELSPLGEAVEQIWQTIDVHHPEVQVMALQMMPEGFVAVAQQHAGQIIMRKKDEV